MTKTGAEARPTVILDEPQSILDWINANRRGLILVTLLIVAIAGGLWFWMRSREIQTSRAEEGLLAIEQSIQQGNIPLAQADLQRLINRYPSTPGGVQAALLLAQIHYDKGEYQQGIDVLARAAGERWGRPLKPTLHSLMGDGYAELEKWGDAATHYREAAEATRFESDRAMYLASAARVLASGGQKAEAIAIWKELAEDPSGPAAAEARVRLGELEAAAVSSQS